MCSLCVSEGIMLLTRGICWGSAGPSDANERPPVAEQELRDSVWFKVQAHSSPCWGAGKLCTKAAPGFVVGTFILSSLAQGWRCQGT